MKSNCMNNREPQNSEGFIQWLSLYTPLNLVIHFGIQIKILCFVVRRHGNKYWLMLGFMLNIFSKAGLILKYSP